MKASKGFTIVELLIVIVVIAILAAITVVAFNGVQQRARDSQRQGDLAAIGKLLKLYAADNGNYLNGAGCGGSSNSGNGWYNYDYDGAGAGKSISQCLIDAGLTSATIKDQSITCSGLTCHAYIKITCGSGTFLYANLEALPHDGTETDATCQPTYDTTYGMNYVLKVD